MTLTTSPDITYNVGRMQATTWLPVTSKNFSQSRKKVSVSTISCWCCAGSLQTFWKWDSSTGAFLGILGIFLRPATLLKMRLSHRYFLVNFGKLFSLQLYQKNETLMKFCEILKNTYFLDYLRTIGSNTQFLLDSFIISIIHF